MSTKKPLTHTQADYDKQNQLAAWRILDNIEKHGGETAFSVVWARKIQAAHFKAVDKELTRESRETAMEGGTK